MIQQIFERFATADRFNLRQLHQEIWPIFEADPVVSEPLRLLRERLGDKHYRSLGNALLRHVFLIELVKVPAIETTKYRVRWFEQLTGDPRWCSFDECLDIARDLTTHLSDGWLDDPDHEQALKLCFEHCLLPYEVPLDYATRPEPNDSSTRIHRRQNLVWISTETMLRTLRLRQFLTDSASSPDAEFFAKVLDRKVVVKTYLTDRALTGEFKTNREKRWETHPRSVQFADRRTCIAIEHTLITQLCAFEGFPKESRDILQAKGFLPQPLETFRCPITLDALSFLAFHEALENPSHGRSEFQVAHLNPLKLDAPASLTGSGHTAGNISWISADGNRIQGSMGITEIRALLRRIASNYEARGWV
ncbi:MAG: hypothetical protein WEA80_03380 [Gemmatimonadaceae bacterium]